MNTRYIKKQLSKTTIYKAGILISLLITVLIAASFHYASAQIDPNEYPPGHPNVTVSATDQLKTFPVPRFKQGHTFLPNFNWMDPIWFGSRWQSGVTDAQAVTNSVDIQTELAKNFNYYVNVSWSGDNFNTAWKNLANANPQYKVGLITFRAQVGGTKIWDQSLPTANYLQNSSGQFIDANGSVTSNKVWRPTAPISSYTQDGLTARGYIQSALSGLTNSVDMVNENGEVFYIYSNSAMGADPQVTTAKNASGLDWETFLAQKVKENDQQAYRDQFMNLSQLSGAKFSEYRMDGHREYNFRWEEMRKISTPINGQYYSTSDFYVRWPNNWKDWQGPWHGLRWMTESRHYEIVAGDRLFSPFIAAGWDDNPEVDVRPAQWLGLLKLLNIYGAEFFYTGFFNESFSQTNPPPNPKGYAWQAVIPAYAQATSTHFEDIMRNGSLMPGDMVDVSHNPDIPYYQFNTGASNKVVAIRKKDAANKYAITGTIQNSSNVIGSTPLAADASITLNGQNLQFKIRRQGSTYIYDNTNTSDPIFYQLDEWHEASHPYRWSSDFNLEAELYDNTNATYNIKTTVPAGTSAGDFRNFTSFITFPDNQTTFTPIEYAFEPRSTTVNTLYFWVRARSRNGQATGMSVSVDNGTAKSIGCISDTNWTWYRLDACSQQAILFTSLSLNDHILRITPTGNKLDIDKIILAVSSSFVMNPQGPVCSSGGTASVTASGPLTFCQGGSVTLTASSGNSYLWSNGATSQAITVSASGTYTVSVNNGTGCAGVSAPQVVTVVSLPSATITPNGPTTFCQGGSVTLTSNSGSSYQWTPGGAITQSITATSAGNYTVKITNVTGCSATSSPVTVTVTTGSSATISANGPTTFCQGGNVMLTSSAGSSYLWLPGNQTSQSITVSSSGSYSVNVTNSSGCSATSSPQNVTVNIPALPSITPSGSTTINQGQTVTLTASAGASYFWAPDGQTTQSIIVGTAGNYRVTVTYSNGCSAISAATTVTVNNSTPVAITLAGSNSICQGDSVLLTASAGYSYLWLPGGQTSQSIYAAASGVYTVQASNGTSAQVTIIVNDKPMIPSITISYIPNSAYQLTAYEPSAVSYLWSNGMTTQTINVSSPQTVSVRAINNFGCAGGLQNMIVAAPVAQPCAKANMLTSYDIIDVAATVAWNPAITADSFMVSGAPQGLGTAFNRIVAGNVSNVHIDGLVAGTVYNWSVKTFCSSGTQTSLNASFATLNGPLNCGSTPIGLSTTNIHESSAMVNWYPATAQQFSVKFRKVGNATYSYKTLNASSNPNFGYLFNLLPTTTYEWHVAAICNGSQSLYSPKATFTTAAMCPFPGSLTAQDVIHNLAVVGWNSNVIADTFKVRYAVVGTSDYFWKTVLYNPNFGRAHLTNLIADTAYYVQIRSKCADGGRSAWSDTLFIHTLPTPQPRVESPDNMLQLNGYPNPAHDNIRFAFVTEKESEYSVKVTDMAGRELMKEFRYANEGVNGDNLNLAGFTSGMYMLVVEQGPMSGRFKFSIH